jgi:ribose/xylose/arabinose/galactoside ABC-type transport system permease subunit
MPERPYKVRDRGVSAPDRREPATGLARAASPAGTSYSATSHGGAILQALDRIDRGPMLAVAAAVGLYAWLSVLEPDALSYQGLTLTLSSTMPLLFVAISQMILISLGDLDLGNGYSVGLANVICALILPRHELLGIGALALIVLAYAGMGALVQWRSLPAIIVTLGASFVWLGLALLVAPSPGGSSPGWLTSITSWNPPLIPLPLLISLLVAVLGTLFVVRLRPGVMLRAAGSNPGAARAFGIPVGTVRVLAYAAAGLAIVIGGLLLTGITQSGDPNASGDFTLMSVAAVILGSGEFRGGRTPVVGVVFGALALTLVSPVLSVLHVPSNYQTGAVGVVLVLVIAGRRLLQR